MGVPSLPGDVQLATAARSRTQLRARGGPVVPTGRARAGDEPVGPAEVQQPARSIRHHGAEGPRPVLGPRVSSGTGAVRGESPGDSRCQRQAGGKRRLGQHRCQVPEGKGLLCQALRGACREPDEGVHLRGMDWRPGNGERGASTKGGSAVRLGHGSEVGAGVLGRGVHGSAVLRQRAVRGADGLLLRLASTPSVGGHGGLRPRLHAESQRTDRQRDRGARPRAFRGRPRQRVHADDGSTQARCAARLHLPPQSQVCVPCGGGGDPRRRADGHRDDSLPCGNGRLNPHQRHQVGNRRYRVRLPIGAERGPSRF